ncbi:MAG: S8 family serine peptidase [Gaiellaceae bacterium]
MKYLAVAFAAASLSGAGTPAVAPNDPAWPTEWGPRSTHIDALWARSTGRAAVVVAVVDTGVAPLADLRGNLVPGWNVVDDDGDTSDDEGHGTWVASVIAARGDNHLGAAGYCWRCSVMPVRVATRSSPATSETIARGIRWAVDHGARVVNVSMSGSRSDPEENAAVAYASAHGAVVIASAGNTGDTAQQFPGAADGALAVAGTDEKGRLYPWSTRGPWVEVAAPGCATIIDGRAGATAEGCGSSFAPPAVAGIAGLLLSLDPKLTAVQVVSALRSSATPVDGIGGGRVDAWRAAAALGLTAAGTPPPAPPTSDRVVTVLGGAVARTKSVRFAAGAGVVDVQFVAASAVPCQMQLPVTPSQVMVAFAGDPRILSLRARVHAGPYRLTVRCARPVRFVLTIDRVAES